MLAEGRCWCILAGKHEATCSVTYSGTFWVFICSLSCTSNVDQMYLFVWLVLLLFNIFKKKPTLTHTKQDLPIKCSVFVFLGFSVWGSIPLEGSSDPLIDETAANLETAGLVQDAEEGGRMREGEIPSMRVFWELVTLVRRGCSQTQVLCLWYSWMVFCGCPLPGVHLAQLVFGPTKYKVEIISMNPSLEIKTPTKKPGR